MSDQTHIDEGGYGFLIWTTRRCDIWQVCLSVVPYWWIFWIGQLWFKRYSAYIVGSAVNVDSRVHGEPLFVGLVANASASNWKGNVQCYVTVGQLVHATMVALEMQGQILSNPRKSTPWLQTRHTLQVTHSPLARLRRSTSRHIHQVDALPRHLRDMDSDVDRNREMNTTIIS